MKTCPSPISKWQWGKVSIIWQDLWTGIEDALLDRNKLYNDAFQQLEVNKQRLTTVSRPGCSLASLCNSRYRKIIYVRFCILTRDDIHVRRVWRYQGGNQNPYIEEQTSQWLKEKVQKDKQRSTKHTYKTKDRVTRTPLKVKVCKHDQLFVKIMRAIAWC